MANLSDPITLCTAVTTGGLPASPTSWGDAIVWRTGRSSAFWVEIWADGAVTATVVKLVGAVLRTITIADDVVESVNTGTDEMTLTGHAYRTGDGPLTIASSGALPGGLTAGTHYWAMVTGANTIKFFPSLAAVIAAGTPAGAGAVDLTSAGSGTITISDVVGGSTPTQRLHWQDLQNLGLAGDGAIGLDAQRGMTHRIAAHNRKVIAYALVGTIASGNMSATAHLDNPVS